MKTTIEVNGYEIVIEENEGVVSVKAVQDDEVVEEFQLETEGSEDFDSEDDDMKDFDDFEGEEEEDFEGESDDEEGESDDDDMDDDDMDDEMGDEGAKLESFQSFLKKRK